MSHIVTIKTEIRDAAAVGAACRRLRLPAPARGKAQLYSREAEGLIVRLPEWKYPIACNLGSGQVQYDNFDGRWGDQKHLDAFLQSYAVEKTKIEARRHGHSVTEQPLADGSIKLVVGLEGGSP